MQPALQSIDAPVSVLCRKKSDHGVEISEKYAFYEQLVTRLERILSKNIRTESDSAELIFVIRIAVHDHFTLANNVLFTDFNI